MCKSCIMKSPFSVPAVANHFWPGNCDALGFHMCDALCFRMCDTLCFRRCDALGSHMRDALCFRMCERLYLCFRMCDALRLRRCDVLGFHMRDVLCFRMCERFDFDAKRWGRSHSKRIQRFEFATPYVFVCATHTSLIIIDH